MWAHYASAGDIDKRYNEDTTVGIKLSSKNDKILCGHIPKHPKLFCHSLLGCKAVHLSWLQVKSFWFAQRWFHCYETKEKPKSCLRCYTWGSELILFLSSKEWTQIVFRLGDYDFLAHSSTKIRGLGEITITTEFHWSPREISPCS